MFLIGISFKKDGMDTIPLFEHHGLSLWLGLYTVRDKAMGHIQSLTLTFSLSHTHRQTRTHTHTQQPVEHNANEGNHPQFSCDAKS